MLACRLCRVPLSAQDGCAVCNPMRRNLVAVGEQEEDRPSLSGVGNEAVTAMRSQVAHVRGKLKDNRDDVKAEARLVSLTNALAKLVGEVRKLQDDGYKAVEAMSFHERAEMFVDWFGSLPPAYRRTLQEKMADFEARIAQPVAAPVKAEVLS